MAFSAEMAEFRFRPIFGHFLGRNQKRSVSRSLHVTCFTLYVHVLELELQEVNINPDLAFSDLLNGRIRFSISIGFVKPDIVFFGEMLPERFAMHQEDCLFTDYLICVGTSLEVCKAPNCGEACRSMDHTHNVGIFAAVDAGSNGPLPSCMSMCPKFDP